jgi:hypothetical protein
MGSITDILNRLREMLILIIGSLPLVMLTLGGIRYVTEEGGHEPVKIVERKWVRRGSNHAGDLQSVGEVSRLDGAVLPPHRSHCVSS